MHINAGQHECRNDDQQAERNAYSGHAGSNRRTEDFRSEGYDEDETKINYEHGGRQRPREAGALGNELLKAPIVLYPVVNILVHRASPGVCKYALRTRGRSWRASRLRATLTLIQIKKRTSRAFRPNASQAIDELGVFGCAHDPVFKNC